MNGIFICQIKYTLDLLDETWIMGIRPVETLMVQIMGDIQESMKDWSGG